MAEQQARRKPVAVLLQDAMQAQGLSERGLAKAIGVSHTTVQAVLAGDRQPDYDTIQKISTFLNVPVIDLLVGEGVDVDALAAFIAAALRTTPELIEPMQEAMQRVLDGRMSMDAYRELLAWISFRFSLQGKVQQKNDAVGSSNEKQHNSEH